PEQSGVFARELHIADAEYRQAFAWLDVDGRLQPRGGHLEEASEAFGGKSGQEPAGIAEMMRGCGMRDARPPGAAAKGEAFGAVLRQLFFGRQQKGAAQVAVMIGFRHRCSLLG